MATWQSICFDIILFLYENPNPKSTGGMSYHVHNVLKSSSLAILLGTPVRCIHHFGRVIGSFRFPIPPTFVMGLFTNPVVLG